MSSQLCVTVWFCRSLLPLGSLLGNDQRCCFSLLQSCLEASLVRGFPLQSLKLPHKHVPRHGETTSGKKIYLGLWYQMINDSLVNPKAVSVLFCPLTITSRSDSSGWRCWSTLLLSLLARARGKQALSMSDQGLGTLSSAPGHGVGTAELS